MTGPKETEEYSNAPKALADLTGRPKEDFTVPEDVEIPDFEDQDLEVKDD